VLVKAASLHSVDPAAAPPGAHGQGMAPWDQARLWISHVPRAHSGVLPTVHGGPNKGCSLVTVLGTEGASCSLGTSHVVTVSPLPQHAENKAVKDSGRAHRRTGRAAGRGRVRVLAFADLR
jgi:hypothetical protein